MKADIDASLSATEREQQAAMQDHLRKQIAAADGWLDFASYMHEALYAEGLGYYVNGLAKFGPEGDFTTAPEVSPLFGLAVGEQVRTSLAANEQLDVVELGAGSGALAESMLSRFRDAGQPVKYRIVEVSAELAARQQARLANFAAPVEITWVREMPLAPINGCLVANEVIDALPVARFRRTEEGVVALGVIATSDGLAIAPAPASEPLLAAVEQIEQRIGMRLPAGYSSEICLALHAWLADLAGSLENGQLLFSDYGFGVKEYYRDDRTDGTLLCHRHHRTNTNPLHLPGLQDITAWVDFSRLAAAGEASGLTLQGFTHQAGFLAAGGIEQFIDAAADPAQHLKVAAGLKTLMLPGEMGERFRFMALGRGKMAPLLGFDGRDLRYAL